MPLGGRGMVREVCRVVSGQRVTADVLGVMVVCPVGDYGDRNDVQRWTSMSLDAAWRGPGHRQKKAPVKSTTLNCESSGDGGLEEEGFVEGSSGGWVVSRGAERSSPCSLDDHV